MTEYHRFADKTDRVHKALSTKVKSFIAHVEACLPPGREKWWTAFSPHKLPEENGTGRGRPKATQTGPEAMQAGAKEALTEALMFEVGPYSGALRCARRLDEPWSVPKAQRSIKSSSSALKYRAGQILNCREQYLTLLLQEDQIRRRGEWRWYRMVRTIRRLAWKNGLCPLVQVNRLQATFQKGVEVEAGFPEVQSTSFGEAALRGLAIRNQTIQDQRPGSGQGPDQGPGQGPSRPHRPPSGRWEDLSLQDVDRDSKAGDAIWALYLSIASGDRVPGVPLNAGSPDAPPSNGTCILQN